MMRAHVRSTGVACAGVEKLGFRFEHPAVILDGWAHRSGCPQLPAPIPDRARLVATGGVVLSQRRPRECHSCTPRWRIWLPWAEPPDGSELAAWK
jgi:hypothetical protein